MKRALPLILSALLIPAITNAGETKILYYQHKIPGPQITKDYYIKESINKRTRRIQSSLCKIDFDCKEPGRHDYLSHD